MMLLVFSRADSSHNMSSSAISTTHHIAGYTRFINQACLDSGMFKLPNRLKKMLDLSRRAYLSNRLNQEILKTLGIKDTSSRLSYILNGMFCLQEEISKGLKEKTGSTLSSQKMIFSTYTGLT